MNVVSFYKLILANSNRDNNDGFTIIELIAVVIVIGILSAIALPSFLTTACGCGSEVKTYIGSMNRAQQAYLLDHKSEFSNSIKKLELGIPEETENYSYSLQITDNSAVHYGIAKKDYLKTGLFDKKPLKSVVGAVFKIPNPEKSKDSQIQTLTIVCINDQPGAIIPPEPILNNGVPSCGLETKKL